MKDKFVSAINEAFLRKIPISVYQQGELIGFGYIEEHTKDTVKILGDHYFKHACEFRLSTAAK